MKCICLFFSAFSPTLFHSLDTINTYILLFYLLYGKNLCTPESLWSLIQRNVYLWIVPQGYLDALHKSSSYSNLMFRCAVHIDSIYAMLLLLIFNKKFPWNLVICCLIVFMRFKCFVILISITSWNVRSVGATYQEVFLAFLILYVEICLSERK